MIRNCTCRTCFKFYNNFISFKHDLFQKRKSMCALIQIRLSFSPLHYHLNFLVQRFWFVCFDEIIQNTRLSFWVITKAPGPPYQPCALASVYKRDTKANQILISCLVPSSCEVCLFFYTWVTEFEYVVFCLCALSTNMDLSSYLDLFVGVQTNGGL